MGIATVFWQMVILFLIILVGVLCSRIGLVSESNSRDISKLIINVFNPALVFSSVLNTSQDGKNDSVALAALIAICMFAAFILIGNLTAKLFSKNEEEQRIYRLMTVFSNIGFIGIPLVNSIFGTSALIYVAIFILIYNILIYTYGVALLEGETSKVFSAGKLKSILNMGTLSSLLTLFVFCFDVPIHPVLNSTVTYLGNVATPLALMSIGFSLGKSKLSEVFLEKRLYAFSLVKLLIIPALGVVILKSLDLPAQIAGVSAVMLAMPVGNMPAILANQYGVNADICSKGIVITTIFSVVTIPLIAGMI